MLSDQFIRNHISFTSNREIYNLCEQFFKNKKIKVNHCNILQKNDDSTINYLCSNRDWLIHYIQSSYSSVGAFEQNDLLSNFEYVTWDSLSENDPILKDSREMISVDHGVAVVEKFSTGTRFYNFANNNKSTSTSDYLIHLNELQDFARFLSEKLNKLLQISYETRFILPTSENPKLVIHGDKSIDMHKNRLYLNKDTYLSLREVECIELYSKGKTAEEIAENLYISRRTVETHINNAKEKTGCINLLQLGYMLATLKFENFGYIPSPY